MMFNLAPQDEVLARREIARKLDVPEGDIKNIRVTDWRCGEVMVSFHNGRKLELLFLDPAIEQRRWRIRRLHKGFWRIESWNHYLGAYVPISVAMSGKRAIEVFAAGGYPDLTST